MGEPQTAREVLADSLMVVVRRELQSGYFSDHMWEIINDAVRIVVDSTALVPRSTVEAAIRLLDALGVTDHHEVMAELRAAVGGET